MIDIHAHILPGIDDGAKTMEESISMAKQAVDSGIETICVTPHILNEVSTALDYNINRTFRSLQTQIRQKGLNLRLMLGSEIYVRSDIFSLRKHSFFSLDQNGRYVLIELPLGKMPAGTRQLVFRLRLDGITPIVAHPERSLTEGNQLQEVNLLVDQGALMQVNAGSFLGYFGRLCRKMAKSLLEMELVHVIASDAHDTNSRSFPVLAQAYQKIAKLTDQNEAHRLFVDNPEKILAGESLSDSEWSYHPKKETNQWRDRVPYGSIIPEKQIAGGTK